MRPLTFILTLTFCLRPTFSAGRNGKFLSVFQVVTFPNDGCNGTDTRIGTCYTPTECTERGGTSNGGCAQGYGVCCGFTVRSGDASSTSVVSENCTYFDSSGTEQSGGYYKASVCRANPNVCQLRLDFEQFIITGPSTATISIEKIKHGVVTPTATLSASAVSQCLTDRFSVTNPGGQSPPVICGINSGEHMYVDSSASCNDLAFQLGNTGGGANIGLRQWSIKITQYSCDFPNLAPAGCTQYFFGEDSQTVQTFNYDGGQHLANQDQDICVRRERGNCRICWTTQMDTDFAVSGTSALTKGIVHKKALAKVCCSYGSSGDMTTGPDCLFIPGAHKVKKTSSTMLGASKFCGRNKGLGSTSSSALAKTICSNRTPFNIRFLSDTYEVTMTEALAANKGFRLTYIQSDNNC